LTTIVKDNLFIQLQNTKISIILNVICKETLN